MSTVGRYTRDVVIARGWAPGSTLENRFVLRLHRIGIRPTDLVQQHRVGSYRLDFADPDVCMAIEADGFFHGMPGAAERDAKRDAWLLEQGWFLFRIGDADEGVLEERLTAAIVLIREERVAQGLPWERVPGSRKKGGPSRLAHAFGYQPPSESP